MDNNFESTFLKVVVEYYYAQTICKLQYSLLLKPKPPYTLTHLVLLIPTCLFKSPAKITFILWDITVYNDPKCQLVLTFET